MLEGHLRIPGGVWDGGSGRLGLATVVPKAQFEVADEHPRSVTSGGGIVVKIRLLTRQADFVVSVFIPPFDPPPEVIVWGSRVFARRPEGYLEVFAYTALPSASVAWADAR